MLVVKLTAANGLNTGVAGPYRIVPVGTFAVTISDADGAIDGSALTAGDITVTETVTDQTMNLTSADGTVSFTLPLAGDTFHYEVEDTRVPPVHIDDEVSSAEQTVSITLEKVGADDIKGRVEDTAGAPLSGVTVTAHQDGDFDHVGEGIRTH